MGGWGRSEPFEANLMIESIFFLLLFLALGLIVYAVGKRDSAFLLLGSVVLMAPGLMLLDESPQAGLERDDGFYVNYLGDNNYAIDFNTSYRNAGNDASVNALGQLFFLGGILGLMISLGLIIKYGKSGGVLQ